jgi:serine phosphatase RsbU (regulator of sigma subunit)
MNAQHDRTDEPRRRTAPWLTGLWAALICLAFAVAGAVAVESVHRSTERQLLQQQADEIAAVLSSAITGVQAPLAAAAEVAAATDADPGAVGAALSESILRSQFRGAAVLDAEGNEVFAIGEPTVLGIDGNSLAAVVAPAMATDGLAVIDTLDLEPRVLGFAHSDSTESRFVVYAEAPLPARTGVPRSADLFDQLDFSLFLGPERVDDQLLYTSADAIPLTGRVAQTTVPFGDGELTLAVSTQGNLADTFSVRLPWIIAVAGLVLAAAVGGAVTLIVRRRHQAEALVDELAESHEQQRTVIRTLQQSLLPRRLPSPTGTALATAFWPADRSLELGGDFYDVFTIDSNSWSVAIGDVCGKGVDAAALTAAVRHTIRAAAHQLTRPAEVLTWARDAVEAFDENTYCTACFGFVRQAPAGLRVDLSLGGHPRPILVTADGATGVGEPGTILGMVPPRFRETVVNVGHDDLLIFYTDGVTDAPGGADVSEEELCQVLARSHGADPEGVIELLREELRRRRPEGTRDDVALVVIKGTAAAQDVPDLAIASSGTA